MRERLDRRTDRTAVDDRISRIGDVRRRLRGDIKLGIAADEGEGTTGESDSDGSREADAEKIGYGVPMQRGRATTACFAAMT